MADKSVQDVASKTASARILGKGVFTGQSPKPSAGGAMPKGEGEAKVSAWVYFGVFAVIIIVIFAAYWAFLMPHYKFSFNINGLEFASDSTTPSLFFPKFRDNNSFVVSVNLDANKNNAWQVNALNLWLVALNADGKKVFSLIRTVDDKGNVLECATNDANVLSMRVLLGDECSALLSDPSKGHVDIRLSNVDRAVLYDNRVEVFASGNDTISHANYFVIKEMYSDFDRILAIVNERINSVS